MDTYSKSLLKKLGKIQYYTFLRNALGIQSFLRNTGETFITENINIEHKEEYFRILGLRTGIETNIIFFVSKGDYDKKEFQSERKNSKRNSHSALDFFNDLNDEIVKILLLSIYGLQRLKKEEKKNLLFDPYIGNTLLELYKPNQYSFILGAGVNLDKNLNVTLGNWNKLIDAMRGRVRSLKGLTTPSIIKGPDIQPKGLSYKIKLCDDLINLEESICNTNYIAPEILKDLDEDLYYKELYYNLYSSFDPSQLNDKINAELEHTNIYQIARIANEQGKAEILTFNYDNVLETVLGLNFGSNYQSVYSGKKEDSSKQIHIIHSHGFYPYISDGKRYHQGIVLSTYEYLDGYFHSNRYARKKLMEQLQKTNILIGNSVSDYEEQKVFFTNFKKIPSSWHFLFVKKSDVALAWEDEYKVCYFSKMGIIPVFFNDFSEIVEYLYNLLR